jgi:hypothetical protein
LRLYSPERRGFPSVNAIFFEALGTGFKTDAGGASGGEHMIRFAIAAALFTAITSTQIQGQTMDIEATIPFQFLVGHVLMPAGDYVIQHKAPSLLIVREQGGHHTAIASLTIGEYRSTPLKTGELEFNRYGETYFLAKLWAPASNAGVALPRSSRETELTREFGLAQRTSIALGRH